MKKQYYKTLKLVGDKTIISYWYTNKPMFLINTNDFVIPLGTHKPRNIPYDQIKWGC